jgi:hypothetical protein
MVSVASPKDPAMRVRSRPIPILTCAIGMMIAMSGTVGADDVVKIGFAATQVAQLLVDDVAAAVGHMTPGTSVPASRPYHKADIAQLSPGATSPVYTRPGFATTFRLVAIRSTRPGTAFFVERGSV